MLLIQESIPQHSSTSPPVSSRITLVMGDAHDILLFRFWFLLRLLIGFLRLSAALWGAQRVPLRIRNLLRPRWPSRSGWITRTRYTWRSLLWRLKLRNCARDASCMPPTFAHSVLPLNTCGPVLQYPVRNGANVKAGKEKPADKPGSRGGVNSGGARGPDGSVGGCHSGGARGMAAVEVLLALMRCL